MLRLTESPDDHPWGRALAGRYGLQIRTATPADAAGVAELMGQAGSPGALPWAERLDRLRHDQGTVLLALEWGPPSGIIVLNWFQTLHHDDPVAQITTLLVAPAERRRGIARLLLKAGAQAARSAGCRSLRLLTPGDELTLPAFARSSGFDPSGTSFARPLRKERGGAAIAD